MYVMPSFDRVELENRTRDNARSSKKSNHHDHHHHHHHHHRNGFLLSRYTGGKMHIENNVRKALTVCVFFPQYYKSERI